MNNKVNFKIDSWNLTRYIKVSLIYSFLQYTLAIFLSLLVFSIVTDLWKFDLSIPFLYSSQGDNLFTGTFIKTVIDTGWNNTNPYLGAPLHYDISNFPMAEGFHYLLIKLISYINSDYGFVMNVFFILSFPLSTFTALFVMKRIGISFPLALGGSVLFAMSYYHFKRYEGHLFLSSYYIIPLATWLAISVAENRMFKGNNSRYELGKTDFIYFIICILIGSSGIYYSVYSMFFIFVGAIIAGLRYKKIVSFVPATILIFLIFLTLAINLSPSIISGLKNEKPLLPPRSPHDSELYALNVTGLIMPDKNEHIGFLQHLAKKYHESSIIRSGEFSRLGIIPSIGFFLLLTFSLLESNLFINNKIKILTQFNIAGLLLGTVGGFGSLIAYSITPVIRSYGRICIFIVFFSLIAFFYVVQQLIKNNSTLDKKYILWLFSGIFLIIGIISQELMHFIPNNLNGAVFAFNNDENFIKTIEKTLPKNSMIFQLPYIQFPEYPPLNHMSCYDPLRGYLHSHHLKWSSGAMKEESADLWQRKVSALPIPLLLKKIVYMGFSGLYINCSGYADKGKNIKDQLSHLIKSAPISSNDNNLIFYDLRDYINQLKNTKSPNTWSEQVKQARQELINGTLHNTLQD